MKTTVTGMFANHAEAAVAVDRLTAAGFATDEVVVVDAATPTRHEFLGRKTTDARRGVLLGTSFGLLGGVLAGTALGGFTGLSMATVVGSLVAAIGGALLGLAVGRSTRSQVRAEMESQIDAGKVLVSVTAHTDLQPLLVDLLARGSSSGLVSSATSFTAGVLAVTPQALADAPDRIASA